MNDKPHGKGRQTYNNGAYYNGEFENGAKHGYGVYMWPDKSGYKGAFKFNEFDG